MAKEVLFDPKIFVSNAEFLFCVDIEIVSSFAV